MFSSLPLFLLHWYLPLTLQKAGNFAHCNLSVGEHEYLFIVCICPLCLLLHLPLPISLSLLPLCLSNFPISAISLSSSSPLLSRLLICQGLYLYLPTHTVQSRQALGLNRWPKLRLVHHYASTKVHVKLNICTL